MKHNLKTCLNKNTWCGQGSHSAFCHQGSCFLPGCVRKPLDQFTWCWQARISSQGIAICRNTLSSVTVISWGRAAALVGSVYSVSSVVSDSWRLWTSAHQASLSMGFSRQEYWSGIFPPQGSNPCFLHRQVDSLLLTTREARWAVGWSSPGCLHGVGCVFHLDCTLLTEYFAELI